MSTEEGKAGSKEEETTMSIEENKGGSEEMRDVDETRRALIKAGWVIPAVIAVQLPTPTAAFASTVHGDTSGDPHSDAGAHLDAGAHVDSGGAHVDAGGHVDGL